MRPAPLAREDALPTLRPPASIGRGLDIEDDRTRGDRKAGAPRLRDPERGRAVEGEEFYVWEESEAEALTTGAELAEAEGAPAEGLRGRAREAGAKSLPRRRERESG